MDALGRSEWTSYARVLAVSLFYIPFTIPRAVQLLPNQLYRAHEPQELDRSCRRQGIDVEFVTGLGDAPALFERLEERALRLCKISTRRETPGGTRLRARGGRPSGTLRCPRRARYLPGV